MGNGHYILNFAGYIGYGVALLSGIFAYVNRDRYKTLINDIYVPGNKELREQLATERQTTTTLSAQNSTLQAQLTEKESHITDLKELNSKQPDFTKLTTLMSNNHKEVILNLTNLAKTLGIKNGK